jgi:hypothetical protein
MIGDQQILGWDTAPGEAKNESHVVRTIRDAAQAAKHLGESLLLLDAYYLTVPALVALQEASAAAGRRLISIVVRAKSNAVAYQLPVRKPGKGRPPKKGPTVKLMELFNSNQGALKHTTVMMYGKDENVSFLSCDLLWGKKHYQLLRFVIAQIPGSAPIILASTNLELSPEGIIRLYSYRFKIECCFFQLKHTIAGFAYRFWSKAMPKLNRYAKKGVDRLESVTDTRSKRLITAAFCATHRYVTAACIAMGLLQICSLRFADEINASPLRWLRTRTNFIPSEASTADYFRITIFKHFGSSSDLPLILLIRKLQRRSFTSDEYGVA